MFQTNGPVKTGADGVNQQIIPAVQSVLNPPNELFKAFYFAKSATPSNQPLPTENAQGVIDPNSLSSVSHVPLWNGVPDYSLDVDQATGDECNIMVAAKGNSGWQWIKADALFGVCAFDNSGNIIDVDDIGANNLFT